LEGKGFVRFWKKVRFGFMRIKNDKRKEERRKSLKRKEGFKVGGS